jgi:hypothetical protein
MAREILYSHLDPLVLEAKSTALKLCEEYLSCKDSSTKKVFGRMVRDALKFEAEIELESRVREATEMLHDLQKPVINPN